MTAAPIQSDTVLWQTLTTRRRPAPPLRGLDAALNRWLQRLRHARRGNAWLRRESHAVDALAPATADLSDADLDARRAELCGVFARRAHTAQHVRAALAVVREIAFRASGQRPYRVQLMGALAMFHGQIVEMVTGEGKTLTAAVAATLLAWRRLPVHVITVNDYLARRDATQNAAIYARCGLRAGAIVGETPGSDRAELYMRPILYTTQKEVVADWLRDRLALRDLAEPVSARWRLEGARAGRPDGAGQVLVPGLHAAIVDEADAILIDEAVTPLIIARPRAEDPQAPLYHRAREMAGRLQAEVHYAVDPIRRRVELNEAGRRRVADIAAPQTHAVWRADRRRDELVQQALAAEHCYREGQHYQVVEDQVVIVDEYTGRYMHDRQWQHGLHQAVEAKHDLPVTADRETLASLSFQRFFRQYPLLAGMTGTAADARAELETTYGAPVRVIPTHRPMRRRRLPDVVHVSASTRWQAVVDEIAQVCAQGRAVLVGTRSIQTSEMLSGLLQDRGLDHQVLNAVHHREEAAIIAQAGAAGAVTIATNMAGRGTDIKLAPGVGERDGLHVILTERHAARRIDRQLFGRSGRQGDPGSARCMLSLEDDLLLKWLPRLGRFVRHLAGARRTGSLPGWTARLFDLAQVRAQHHASRARASVVRHEDDLDRALPG